MPNSDQKSHKWWHIKLGTVLVIAGVGIVKPTILDVLLSGLNKIFGLGLDLNTPRSLGVALIGLGFLVIIYGEWARQRNHSKQMFIAFRHQSLGAFSAGLTPRHLPPEFADREILALECAQSTYLTDGAVDPVGAVHLQLQKQADLKALRNSFAETPMGYYGLVHVPLQFLAGCFMSTHARVHLFDLNRHTNEWEHLKDRRLHHEVVVNVTPFSMPADAVAVVIRIAISYEIDVADAAEVVEGPFEDIRIGLPSPRIDAINSYEDVDKICKLFRGVLDEICTRVVKSALVHVFYAGPVPLGFSLGRQISKTIHHRVVVHNYTPSSTPRYQWAVEVTSDGPADKIVVLEKKQRPRR